MLDVELGLLPSLGGIPESLIAVAKTDSYILAINEGLLDTTMLMKLIIFLRCTLGDAYRAVQQQWKRSSLIAMGAKIAPSVIIEQGQGCQIRSGVGSSIGRGTLLIANSDGGLSGKLIIGKHSAINEFNNIRAAGGEIIIGDYCQIAQFCTLVASNHSIETEEYMIHAPWDTSKTSITIEDDVWIGANSLILPGVRIGRGAVVGAGSVVTKDIPPYAIYAGNPARLLRVRIIHA